MSTPTRYLRFAADGYCEWTDVAPTDAQLAGLARTAWVVLRITPVAIERLFAVGPTGEVTLFPGEATWHPVKPSEGDDQFPAALVPDSTGGGSGRGG